MVYHHILRDTTLILGCAASPSRCLPPPHETGNYGLRISPQWRHLSSRRGCRTGVRGTSGRCRGGFAEQVAGNVEKGEAPTLLRHRLEIRLDKNLNGVLAGIYLHTNGRVA